MWDWEKKTEMIVVNCVCDFNDPAPKERGVYCFTLSCLCVCVCVRGRAKLCLGMPYNEIHFKRMHFE